MSTDLPAASDGDGTEPGKNADIAGLATFTSMVLGGSLGWGGSPRGNPQPARRAWRSPPTGT